MKKMFSIVVILLLLYIISQTIYSYTRGSRVTKYNLVIDEVEYQIKENFTSGFKNRETNRFEKSNYYFEINTNDGAVISFKMVGDFTGKRELIKNLKIYDDNNMMCIYPIFKDEIHAVDVICKDNEKQYLFGSLKGQNNNIDDFVASLKKEGHDHPSWNDANNEEKKVENFIMYPANFIEDQIITLWLYKGFSKITKESDRMFLFSQEQYKPLLTSMVNQYYVIPDYGKDHKFERFFVTNLLTGKMDTLKMDKPISYDSFIQGVVDNKIYLIDKNEKTQYSIDIYSKRVEITGDENNNTKYYDHGKWESKTIFETIDNTLLFNVQGNIPEKLKSYNPLYVDDVGGTTDGYYYLYIKENNIINVYRVDKQNLDILTLLFSVSSIKDIQYESSDIYFVKDDTLFMYRDELGVRPLIKYNEFRFNQDKLYNVYINN